MEHLIEMLDGQPSWVIPTIGWGLLWMFTSLARAGVNRLSGMTGNVTESAKLFQFLKEKLGQEARWERDGSSIKYRTQPGTPASECTLFIDPTGKTIKMDGQYVHDHLGWRQKRKVRKLAAKIGTNLDRQAASQKLSSLMAKVG